MTRLLADLDRLAAHNRRLRARVASLEAVEVAAHQLLAAPAHRDHEARARLWQAMGIAEGVRS